MSADYSSCRDPLRTPVQPKRPTHALEPSSAAYGRYGALRNEVPEEDMKWDLKAPAGHAMEDLRISPPRGSASRSRREKEEYMQGVRRGVLGAEYMEEPRHSRLAFEEEMDLAALATQGVGRWEPWSVLRPAFMVSKAADAAVWEDLKDIRPPMYDGNPFNLERFLEKLDDWGMTVTEDMETAAADKYVFKRFRWRLPGVLQELYLVAAKKGKNTTARRRRSGSTSKSGGTPRRSPPRGGEPSSFSMMAG